MNLILTPKEIARFWSHVDMSGDCWEWQGSRRQGSHQYGRFWVQGKRYNAHRIAYLLEHGPFSNDLDVLHSCDNPPCVRPVHLFLGTAEDSAQDMARKGRAPSHLVVLTDDEVAEIRRRYCRSSYHVSNVRALAAEFGVTVSHIKRLVTPSDHRRRKVRFDHKVDANADR